MEKYRPKRLEDVSHQEEVVATLQNAIKTNRLPHLLLYGPPGTGKTSVALALCRSLWHPSQWSRRVLELNASDERGISVVRDKMKTFASLAVPQSTNNYFSKNKDEPQYPNPPFKIIILDEADTVTPAAQAALRRIIEATSKVTRFILICNYVTRIIEPLASRCAKFRFQPLPMDSMVARLSSIAQQESVHNIQQVTDILSLCQGDMRRAVMTLQSAHTIQAQTKEDLAELVGLPPPDIWNHIVQNLNSSMTYTQLEQHVQELLNQGYAVLSLLKNLWEHHLLRHPQLSDQHKAKLAIQIAQADHHLIDGADDYFQLMLVCSTALQCFSSTN